MRVSWLGKERWSKLGFWEPCGRWLGTWQIWRQCQPQQHPSRLCPGLLNKEPLSPSWGVLMEQASLLWLKLTWSFGWRSITVHHSSHFPPVLDFCPLTFAASHLWGGDTILIFTWEQQRPTDIKWLIPDPNWGSNSSFGHKSVTSSMPICLHQTWPASSLFPSTGQTLFEMKSCFDL